MLVPQINTGSTYQSSLSLLLTLFMSNYDTCVFYKDNRSSENKNFEDLVYSLLFHDEKSIVTLLTTDDSSGEHILPKINKNHLNIYLISYVDSNVINHLNRIYKQSNQYDVWNLIFIHGPERVDHIIDFISKQSNVISSTTLVMLSIRHGLNIRNVTSNSWNELATINDSLSIRKEMFEKHINLQGQELVISFNTHPLTNFLFSVLKQPLFIGLDAFIGVEIYQQINALPVYTSFSIDNLKKLRKSEIIVTPYEVREEIEMQSRFTPHKHPYLSLIFDLSKLDKIWINLNADVNRKAEINMSPALVENTAEMDFLYPHDRECITLIVPRADAALSFISKIIESNEGLVFGISLVAFWVIRLIVLRSPKKKWPALLIDTYGFYLAQISVTPQNLGEKMLLLSLMITSIQTSALLAGIFFRYIMDNETRKSISTVNALLETEMNILMLKNHFNTTLVKEWLSLVSPELLNRTIFTDVTTFIKECSAQTSEYAFGLPENAAAFMNLLQQNNYNFYYMLKENLYCSRTSYHIKHNSPMTQKINEVIQGMLENGIIRQYYRWTQQAFVRNFNYEMSIRMDFTESLGLWQIMGAFYIYAGCVLTCLLVFLSERIIYALQVAISVSKRSTNVTSSQNAINDHMNEKSLKENGKFILSPSEIIEAPSSVSLMELNTLPEPDECRSEVFSILGACGVDYKYFECEKETNTLVDIELEVTPVESQTSGES